MRGSVHAFIYPRQWASTHGTSHEVLAPHESLFYADDLYCQQVLAKFVQNMTPSVFINLLLTVAEVWPNADSARRGQGPYLGC